MSTSMQFCIEFGLNLVCVVFFSELFFPYHRLRQNVTGALSATKGKRGRCGRPVPSKLTDDNSRKGKTFFVFTICSGKIISGRKNSS